MAVYFTRKNFDIIQFLKRKIVLFIRSSLTDCVKLKIKIYQRLRMGASEFEIILILFLIFKMK